MTASQQGDNRKFLTGRWLALVIVTVAGFALRFMNIDRWPLWGDEGLTLLVAQWPLERLFLQPVDPTPGLYYGLHKLILGPMVGVTAARSISLICGTLLIPATYWLAKEARAPALLTAAVIALSYPLIDYSQEARAYALLVLLITISAAFFIRWSRFQRLRHLLPALLFGLLSFYTHLASIFWIGPMVVAVLWIARRQAILPLLLFGLLAVPEMSRLLAFRHTNFSWLAQATPAQAGETFARALMPFRPTVIWAVPLTLLIGWRLWTYRKQMARWAKENPGAAFTLAVLLGSPVLLWTFGLIVKPIFMTRTVLVAIPGFMVGIALLLAFEHRLVRLGVVALYGASLLVTGTAREKDDWRAIAKRVGDDAILMCQPWQAAAFRHTLSRDNQMLLRYDYGLVEVWGEPWPATYFEVQVSKRRMEEARRRGMAADPDSYPVWPVRSGQVEQLAAAPMTLREAIAYCDSYRVADRQRNYLAD